MHKIVVTGGAGFIGSHLTEELVRRGHRVRAMALYNMWSSSGWLETLPPDVRASVDVVFGDLRDAAITIYQFKDNKKTVKAVLDEAGVMVKAFARLAVGGA